MKKLVFKKKVKATLAQIEKKINKDFFQQMIPPIYPVELIDFEIPKDGAEFSIALKGPYPLKIWQGHMHSFSRQVKEYEFVDEGKRLPFPFSKWRHKHRFVESPVGGTFLVDEIEYECVDERFEKVVEMFLFFYFKYRQFQYQKLLKD
jgi:ligand-binding SRPBCC domain-containing protein